MRTVSCHCCCFCPVLPLWSSEIALLIFPAHIRVIRVWDVVQNHDNLSRSIDLTIDRIENSISRGQESLLYSELDNFNAGQQLISNSSVEIHVPRVFPMREGVEMQTSDIPSQHSLGDRSRRHYPPASDDPRQFTLLKFYELDAGAVKLLLSENDGETELPFTPGPKEHEIIHFKSNPQRSILLMGRR